jgi:hypothetical protein
MNPAEAFAETTSHALEAGERIADRRTVPGIVGAAVEGAFGWLSRS